jgi:hypothetical protein
MIVTISLQSFYGTVKAYPRNDAAKAFATIAGTTTLTRATLKQIVTLGYDVVLINGNELTLDNLTS